MTITITKAYDGNVMATERGSNGRVYQRPVGWRWVVEVDGVTAADFDRRRHAVDFVTRTYGADAVPTRQKGIGGQ